MTSRTAAVFSSLLLLVVCAAPSAAQQPRIVNGRVTTQTAPSPLADGVRTLANTRTEPTWIGYTVPVVAGERRMCCGGDGSTYISGSVVMVDGQAWSPCRLEPRVDNTQGSRGGTAPTAPAAPVQLEAPDQVAVLLRVAERRIERIRIFSPDCELDAGGREVLWLQNVRPAESIAMLEGLATTDAAERRERVVDGAVSAIALHRDAAADAALERFVAPAQPVSLRR